MKTIINICFATIFLIICGCASNQHALNLKMKTTVFNLNEIKNNNFTEIYSFWSCLDSLDRNHVTRNRIINITKSEDDKYYYIYVSIKDAFDYCPVILIDKLNGKLITTFNNCPA